MCLATVKVGLERTWPRLTANPCLYGICNEALVTRLMMKLLKFCDGGLFHSSELNGRAECNE
jgi:hypothetical protein